MSLNKFLEKFSAEIGGQYSDYDINKSVVIVPLNQNRFQAVLGTENNENGQVVYHFTSKVCMYHPNIELKELLKNNINYHYSKFFIDDDVLRVAASVFKKDVTDDVLKEIIKEVANTADEWEYKLTGLDVN
jgi:hypothetical protein